MRRQDLAHVLRASCNIVKDGDIIVVGSQSILGSYDETELPRAATMSAEADVAFRSDPDTSKAETVEGAIGELSPFHDAFDYYVDGVDISLIALPDGWEDRLVEWDLQGSLPAEPRFLEPHDLAVAKLVANREKDREFVVALLDAGLLDGEVIKDRVALLPPPHAASAPGILNWVDAYLASLD